MHRSAVGALAVNPQPPAAFEKKILRSRIAAPYLFELCTTLQRNPIWAEVIDIAVIIFSL